MSNVILKNGQLIKYDGMDAVANMDKGELTLLFAVAEGAFILEDIDLNLIEASL